MNPWTLCLLIGSFVPVPRIPTTLVPCDGCKAVVKSASLPKEQKLGPSTSAAVGRTRKTEKSLAVRVMDRLQQAEAHESNRHLREDYRQAWITVSFLQKDVPNAFVQASYRMYGLHPDSVWPAIVADRKARLGAEYFDFYDSADNLRPDVPKIPPNTADADTHAANEASHDDWDIAGLVPQERKLV